MLKWRNVASRRAAVFVVAMAWFSLARAADTIFFNCPYLEATREMVREADGPARTAFAQNPVGSKAYEDSRAILLEEIANRTDACKETKRRILFKQFDRNAVREETDPRFAESLRTFNQALNFIADQSGKPLNAVFPSYDRWNRMEAETVGKGLDQRLTAYEVRYGPESERINFLEWFAGEWLLKGTEAGPSAWEPIARLTPVQFTSAGSGLVSTFQLGLNRYFLSGKAPGPLGWIGIKNHAGLALAMQYLDNPRPGRFEGKPAYGFVFHMDRREVGLTWAEAEKQVKITLGYAFQFVPLAF